MTGTKGFTLVETLVSVGVFTVIMGLVATVMFNTFAHDRKTRVSRMLYEETRVVLERMVKEVRKGTIDFEEYYSWHRCAGSCADVPADDTDYGKNYGYYALQFYRDASAGVTQAPPDPAELSRQDENIGINISPLEPALGDGRAHVRCDDVNLPSYPGTTDGYEQCELYIISMDGTEKTIFRVEQDGTEYRLSMLKLQGHDYGIDHVAAISGGDPTENDGQMDTWLADSNSDFAGYDFRLIQPDTINIKSLKFFISPLEDPRKNFACFEAGADCLAGVQIQPHVTIILTAEPSLPQLAGIKGKIPTVTLQTTITARAQNEVTSVK